MKTAFLVDCVICFVEGCPPAVPEVLSNFQGFWRSSLTAAGLHQCINVIFII